MLYTSLLPGFPTMKHQSVKKKKKSPFLMRTWGLIFSMVPGDVAVGMPLPVMGLAASFCARDMQTAPLDSHKILVLKLRPVFSEQSSFPETPKTTLYWPGACVFMFCVSKREKMPFSKGQMLLAKTTLTHYAQ